MKKSHLYIFIILMVTVVLTSCNNITKSIDDTLHGQPKQNKEDAFMASTNEKTINFLSDAHALAQAETALRNLTELKGKKINIYDVINFYDDGRILCKVQDPDTLQNVNEYDYSSEKGEWGAKQPVNITAAVSADMSTEIVPLDSIPFASIVKIGKVFADSARRVGSKSTLNYIYYVPRVKEWYCDDIKGTRVNYQIYFNTDGTVKEFKRE